jgi:hypothetical protein
MEIEAALLCDAATDQNGKLNVLGAFDTAFSANYPMVLPHCAVAFRMRFSKVEEGEHRIRVRFADEDGRPVLPPLEAGVKVGFAPGQDSAVSNLILNIQGLKLPKPGSYAIDMAVDGRHEKSLPLRATKP